MQKSLTDRKYLDCIKGVAIFLMLWGHCIQYCTYGQFDFFQNVVFKAIYSFHMPLFMLVSGYLFWFSCGRREFYPLLVHRTQALLQPIFVCNFFVWLTTAFVYERNVFGIISGGWIKNLSGLWFLWSVLGSSIVLCVVTKVISSRFLKIITIALGFVFVGIFPNFAQNLIMYPHFLIGFYFAKYKPCLSEALLRLRYVTLVTFPALLTVYLLGDYTFVNSFSFAGGYRAVLMNFWEWILGVFGSIFVLVVLEIVYKTLFAKIPKLATPISMLGAKSLQVYCVSVSVLSFWLPKLFGKLCKTIGENIFASNMLVYDFIFTPLLAVAYAVLIYYIVRLMEKIKISKIVFGR